MPQLEMIQGLAGVPGYRTMGVHAGLKQSRPDVAVIVSDTTDTQCAAVFTQNAFAGAPVHIGRQHVADGNVQAIAINSGNANACTGRQGLRDALSMCNTTAELLSLEPTQILPCSTGRIGVPMPMDKVLAGIKEAVERLDEATGAEISQAILTTDTGPKEARVEFEANGQTYILAGIAKGAGMIHPNMATMLAFMITDAPVPAASLRTLLKTTTDATFNQISVDGDESTNDTATIMANGASGGDPITEDHPDWGNLQAAVETVATQLAKRIAADGEGATRLFEVIIEGAHDVKSARTAARAVARSNLVKAAVHGHDPNWGRIVAAIGATDAPVDAERVDLRIESRHGDITVLEAGQPLDNLDEASKIMTASEIRLVVDLGVGNANGTAWGCDLTEEYVEFNAEYTT